MTSQSVIRAFVDEHSDAERFRFKPWQDKVLSPLDLQGQIEQAIDQHGFWDTYGELRMASGPIVRLAPLEFKSVGYRVTAEAGLSISGEYKTLERALEVLSVFASLVWELSEAGITEGMVERPPPELPWPPGPR